MGVKVQDPKQNHHEFWGTLEYDGEGTNDIPGGKPTFNFLKLSADGHFIINGTYVRIGTLYNDKGAAKAAIVEEAARQNLTIDLSSLDGPGFPDGPYVDLESIDDKKTSILVLALNECTEERFRDDKWLDGYKNDTLGKALIKMGRDIPRRLPKY